MLGVVAHGTHIPWTNSEASLNDTMSPEHVDRVRVQELPEPGATQLRNQVQQVHVPDGTPEIEFDLPNNASVSPEVNGALWKHR